MKASVKVLAFCIFVSLGMLMASSARAQCSLCASSVAGSVNSHTEKAGLGLNKGIVMLLTMPYAAAGVIGLLWYTNSRSKKRKNIVAKGMETKS